MDEKKKKKHVQNIILKNVLLKVKRKKEVCT